MMMSVTDFTAEYEALSIGSRLHFFNALSTQFTVLGRGRYSMSPEPIGEISEVLFRYFNEIQHHIAGYIGGLLSEPPVRIEGKYIIPGLLTHSDGQIGTEEIRWAFTQAMTYAISVEAKVELTYNSLAADDDQ